jgi:hypothetical protein
VQTLTNVGRTPWPRAHHLIAPDKSACAKFPVTGLFGPDSPATYQHRAFLLKVRSIRGSGPCKTDLFQSCCSVVAGAERLVAPHVTRACSKRISTALSQPASGLLRHKLEARAAEKVLFRAAPYSLVILLSPAM